MHWCVRPRGAAPQPPLLQQVMFVSFATALQAYLLFRRADFVALVGSAPAQIVNVQTALRAYLLPLVLQFTF